MSNSDIALKLIELEMKHIHDQDMLYLKSLQMKEEMLRNMIELKLNDEPLSLFKKAHKKWEDELSALELELSQLYEKMGESFEELSKQ